jgi:hypothetical protein
MDSSQAAAVSAYSALASDAASTALAIQRGLPTEVRPQGALQKQLSSLSIRLQQFAHHASQLSYCVANTAVVHQPLGTILGLSHTKCHDGLGILTASWDSTGTDGDGKRRGALIAGYDDFVAAYSRLFVLGTQLLLMWVLKLPLTI